MSPMEFHETHAQLQPGGEWRRGGATTLMIVKAALTVMDGHGVLLMGRDRPHAEGLCQQLAHYLTVLDPTLPQTSQGHRIQVRHPNAMLYIDRVPEQSGWARRGRPSNTVFVDTEHANTLSARQKPYTDIAVLEPEPAGGFKAFNAQGVFLLELTEEGGQEVLDLDARVCVRNP